MAKHAKKPSRSGERLARINAMKDGGVVTIVLGIMQDAGLPHAGCRCLRCSAAYAESHLIQYAACLAIVDARRPKSAVWLIDATPDIKYQLNLLSHLLGPHPTRPHRVCQPQGIFLTHAHMGHTAGLAQLGPEGMHVADLPIYASPGLVTVLKETRLWQPLIANLQLTSLQPGHHLALAADLNVTPIPVPHRDELDSVTFAFQIQGPVRSLLYVPDIDAWEQWPKARDLMEEVDYALVDASFYSNDELGGRAGVAHPLVPDTLDMFGDLPVQLVLTHLNHTNPLLDLDSRERKIVEETGVQIAFTGQAFSL